MISNCFLQRLKKILIKKQQVISFYITNQYKVWRLDKIRAMHSTKCLRCDSYQKLDQYQCKNCRFHYILCYVCSGAYALCLDCKQRLIKVRSIDSVTQTRSSYFTSNTSNVMSTRQVRQPIKIAKTTTDPVGRHFRSTDSYKNKIYPALQQQKQSPKQPSAKIDKPKRYVYDNDQLDSHYLKGKINEKVGQDYRTGTQLYQRYHNKIGDNKLKLLDEGFGKGTRNDPKQALTKQKTQVQYGFEKKASYNMQKKPFQTYKTGSHQPTNLKRDNYLSSQKQPQPLTKEKQIQLARQSIKIKKGYIHNGCQITHKLYDLVKLLKMSSKYSSDVVLAGCHTYLDKAFLKQIIQDKCLVCGLGNQSESQLSYELRNGYHLCYRCYSLINIEKQIQHSIQPLLYKCIACDYTQVKKKRQEMHIGQDQNDQSQLCCKRCYGKATFQQQRLHYIKQIQKINQKKPAIKREHYQIGKKIQQQKPKQKIDLAKQVKSCIRQKNQPSSNTRQQSLPKTYDKAPIYKFDYKPTMINNWEMNDYGMRNIRKQEKSIRQQERDKAQQCILCNTLTFYPVLVDGMAICNGCSNSNKEEFGKKQFEKKDFLQKLKIEQYEKPTNTPLNKQIYDKKREENEKQVIHPLRKFGIESEEILTTPKQELQKFKQPNQLSIPQKPTFDLISSKSSNNSNTYSSTNESTSYHNSLAQSQASQKQNQIKLNCQGCLKQITDFGDLGVKNENGLVFCFRCHNEQAEMFENRQNFSKRVSTFEDYKGKWEENKATPNPSGYNQSSPKTYQLYEQQKFVEVKPSPQKSFFSGQKEKTLQIKPLNNNSKSINRKQDLNSKNSQSFSVQAEPCFKIQSVAPKEQNPIKTQNPTLKEQTKLTPLQQMRRKIQDQGIIRQDDEKKVEKSNAPKIDNINHSKIEKSNPLKLQNSNPSRIQNSVDYANHHTKNICQNSRIKSSVSSRKSFQLPQTTNTYHPQVQYSNILTPSMLQDQPINQTFSHPESPQKKEKSSEQHSMSLCYDPREQELRDDLIPTNDQQEEKLFAMSKNGTKKPPSKIKWVNDSRLTLTEFEALRTIVDELGSGEEKCTLHKNRSFAKQKPQDDYIKQSFINQLSDQKPIKNQKLQIKLQDPQQPPPTKLLSCTTCQLTLQLTKGFILNQNTQPQTKVTLTITNPPKTFMCQHCYYRQYFGQKQQVIGLVRKSRVEGERCQVGDRKVGYKSLRQEEDVKKRNRSMVKVSMAGSKVYAQKERVTTALLPSQAYGLLGASTSHPQSKTSQQRLTTPSSSQANTHPATIPPSTHINLNQKSFLQQKLAKPQRKPQTPYSEIHRISQISESTTNRDHYKSDIVGDAMIGKKKYLCQRCNNDVTILCFDEYCVECFKKDE